MPTYVIPFAGIPAPEQFISISPLPQCCHGTMENSRQPFVVVLNSLFPVEIVIGPSAGGGVGMRLGLTMGRSHRRISVSHSDNKATALLSVGFSKRSTKKLHVRSYF
jgi:hypothetical protein